MPLSETGLYVLEANRPLTFSRWKCRAFVQDTRLLAFSPLSCLEHTIDLAEFIQIFILNCRPIDITLLSFVVISGQS